MIELPKPVRSCLVINHAPAVGQLESMVQEHEPVGVLLADRQRAQLYVFELGRLVDRSELLDELPRDYDSRGERERGTPAHHREELAHQHLRHAARAAFDLWQARGFHHLAIGAPDAIAGELEAGAAPVPPRAALRPDPRRGRAPPPPRCWPPPRRWRPRSSERARPRIVARLKEAAATGGRGVAGLAGTLKALVRAPGRAPRRVEGLRRAGLAGARAPARWRSSGPATPTPARRWSGSTTSWRTPSRRRSARASPSRSAWPTPTSTSWAASAPCSATDRPPLRSVGLDVGGTKVLGVAIDPARPARSSPRTASPPPTAATGWSTCCSSWRATLAPDAAAIGVGVPGLSTGPARCTWVRTCAACRTSRSPSCSSRAVRGAGHRRQRRQLPRRGRARRRRRAARDLLGDRDVLHAPKVATDVQGAGPVDEPGTPTPIAAASGRSVRASSRSTSTSPSPPSGVGTRSSARTGPARADRWRRRGSSSRRRRGRR